MPTTITTKAKNKPSLNGSERLQENDYISCQQFNFRLCDIDGFLFQEAGLFNPAQTIVYFKGYTAPVPDQEKVLYHLLSKNLNCLPVE